MPIKKSGPDVAAADELRPAEPAAVVEGQVDAGELAGEVDPGEEVAVELLELRAVEDLRDELRTPAWLFAAAKMKHDWPIGAELSVAGYQAALEAAANEVIR
jgi:hypothetical protein